ncbi:unnamed protein product, partial [Anisakis simplex]|uniref:ZP domain-containing protein n=1 Tax=Anisakis simplex TaxID=6269 RepID=A0A0M3JTN0_ANISI
EPVVKCESESISIVFKTLQSFSGRTFVKGYIQDADCVQAGNDRYEHEFSVKFDQCGLRRAREYNGVSVSTTIIISFHHRLTENLILKVFLTKVDRAYRLNCFYMEATKTVTQQIDVSMMTTVELKVQSQMPLCRYEILSSGPYGSPIRYAKIGDSIYHKWTCMSDIDDIYCMRVHSCTVYDGQGGERIQVLDAQGCSVDKFVLIDLDYVDDLIAGQEAHVFKFADRPALYFNCQLELTLKDSTEGCARTRPHCNSQVEVRPSGKASEQLADDGRSPEPPTAVFQPTDSYGNEAEPDFLHHFVSINFSADEQSRRKNVSNEKPYVVAAPPGINPPSYDEISSTAQELSSYALKSTASDTQSASYKRLLRRRRKTSIITTQTNPHLADVDLPEQILTVFGIEDGPPPS